MGHDYEDSGSPNASGHISSNQRRLPYLPVSEKYEGIGSRRLCFKRLSTHHSSIRKVKCDQAKPDCKKCTSTGRKCDGYPTPSLPKVSPPPSARILAPATLSPFTGECREHVSTMFEQHAFRRFIEHDIPLLVLVLPATEWLQVILAQAYREPAVISAIVAASVAVNQYQNVLHHSMARRLTSMADERSLAQYHKATTLLSKHLRSRPADLEPVLACCLLFAIIEGSQDNQMAALTHLRLGHQMIRDHADSLESTPVAIFFKAFVALVGDSIDNGRRSIVGRECVPESNLTITLTGSCFHSLAHARAVLDRIIAEASDFQASLVARADALIPVQNNIAASLSASAQLCVVHSLARTIAGQPEYSSRQAHLLQAHNAWYHSFRDLYEFLTGDDKRRSTLAQLKHFSSSFTVRTATTIHELQHDQYEPEFVHMLDLAELYIDQGTRLLRPPNRKPISFTVQRSFSVEYAILPALLLIAVKSRHRATRKRAIDVLVSSARHEAHQYSFWLAVRAEIVMGIEEERTKSLHQEQTSHAEDVAKAPAMALTTTTSIPEQARIMDAVFDELAAPLDMKVLVTRYQHEAAGRLELAQYVADVSGAVPLFRLESLVVLPFSCG